MCVCVLVTLPNMHNWHGKLLFSLWSVRMKWIKLKVLSICELWCASKVTFECNGHDYDQNQMQLTRCAIHVFMHMTQLSMVQFFLNGIDLTEWGNKANQTERNSNQTIYCSDSDKIFFSFVWFRCWEEWRWYTERKSTFTFLFHNIHIQEMSCSGLQLEYFKFCYVS